MKKKGPTDVILALLLTLALLMAIGFLQIGDDTIAKMLSALNSFVSLFIAFEGIWPNEPG